MTNVADEDKSEFYDNVEPPLKNHWDIVIAPHPDVYKNLLKDPFFLINFVGGRVAGAMSPVKTIAENDRISRFHIQKVSVPFANYVYTRVGNRQYVTDVEYPNEVTLTFLEDSDNSVGKYLMHWMNEIHDMDGGSLGGLISGALSLIGGIAGSSVNANKAMAQKFQSDPGLAKKNATIIPHDADGNASDIWYVLEGLSIKTIEPLEYAYGEGDPVAWSVVCAIDNTTTMSGIMTKSGKAGTAARVAGMFL